MNIVLFGFTEDRSAANWRPKVDDVPRHVVGHDVHHSFLLICIQVGRFLCCSEHSANITRKAHQRANLIHRCFTSKIPIY